MKRSGKRNKLNPPLTEAKLPSLKSSYTLRSPSRVLNIVSTLDLQQDRLIFVELLLPYTLVSAKAGQSWEAIQYLSRTVPQTCKVRHHHPTWLPKQYVLLPYSSETWLPLMTTRIFKTFSRRIDYPCMDTSPRLLSTCLSYPTWCEKIVLM